MRLLIRLLALLSLLAAPSFAQQATSSFSPTAAPVTLSVSGTTARVAFPSTGPTAVIINTGANAAYVNFGGSAVTATPGGNLIGPGCPAAFDVNGQGYVAAITASSTTSLLVATGSGLPTLTPNGCALTASISGGTVTANPTSGTSTDISGTVTLGGTYQTAAASSASRKNCTIQNPTTATEVLNVKFGTMASPYTLSPGASISALNGTVVATDAITLTAATTAHAFAGTCQ